MAIPSWAVETLIRGVGNMVDRVPPDRIDQIKQRASSLLDELPRTAARGVDNLFRGARAGREMMDRWTRRHTALVTPVINASGCLGDSRVSGVPLGDHAIELAVESFSGAALSTPTARQRLDRRLNRCAGDDRLSVLVAGNVDAACLAIGLCHPGRPIFVHRSEAIRLSGGTPIPDAFLPVEAGRDGLGHVHEVGSVDGVSAADTIGLPENAILLAVDNGADRPPWFVEVEAAEGHDQRLRVVIMTGSSGLKPPQGEHLQSLTSLSPQPRSAHDHLASGAANIVIVPGDGLIGGPPCGLLVGRRSAVEVIAANRVWRALEGGIATRAMITEALEGCSAPTASRHPIGELLATSEENLKSRSERLAIRISAEETIRSCQVGNAPATLTPHGPWKIGSRQLQLRHRDLPAARWAESLAESVPAILAGVIDDTVVLDLRWVQPSDDAALAAALVGGATTETAAAPGVE